MDKITEEYIKNCLKKADNDLQNVKNNYAVKEEYIPTDTVCFHCQQAGEKYFKGYLVFVGIKFPSTHSLADLVLLCSEKDFTFKEIMEKAESLTPFAVLKYAIPMIFMLQQLKKQKRCMRQRKRLGPLF